ncbi:hypothetical protein GCM10025331_84320 [Actinoplanes utahensis]|nr:hypothetical protein Aut01nite_00120 [Actinoplanes utahensis]
MRTGALVHLAVFKYRCADHSGAWAASQGVAEEWAASKTFVVTLWVIRRAPLPRVGSIGYN